MLEQLPSYITILFILTAIATVLLFYYAAGKSVSVLVLLSVWLLIQGLISYTKYYTVTDSMPPRFTLATALPVLTIIYLFASESGRKFVDKLDLKTLTYLQSVRIPVEIILFLLFQYGYIPGLMTFEGRNFDILAGITAPFIAYFGFTKKILSNKLILIWNIISLGLVLNIVINAVFSAPFRIQMFAFDLPNVAVLYFPFVWLPCCIVPIVVISHLASIRQLLLMRK